MILNSYYLSFRKRERESCRETDLLRPVIAAGARCPFMIFSFQLLRTRLRGQNTRARIYGLDAHARTLARPSKLDKECAGVGSEMQRDIIVRQTNVDVRATSAERAVYF